MNKQINKLVVGDTFNGLTVKSVDVVDNGTTLTYKVKLDGKLEKISQDSFSDSELAIDIKLPNKVKSIEEKSFINCTNLSTLNLSNVNSSVINNTSICYPLSDKISLPDNSQLVSLENSNNEGKVYWKQNISDITTNYKVTNVVQGEEIDAPEMTTSRTGYTFKGWSNNINGLLYKNSLGVMDTSLNRTFYAYWYKGSENLCTIHWKFNNGTSNENCTYEPLNATIYPPYIDENGNSIGNPQYTGYTFKGWSKTSSGTATTDYGTVKSTDDMYFYAVWEKIEEETEPTEPEETTELQYIVGLSKDNLKNTNISGTTFVIPDEYDTIDIPAINEKTIFGDSDSYYTKYVSGTTYHTWFILVPNTVTVKIEDGINGEGGPLNDATKVDATATLKGVTYNVYLNYYPLGIKGSVARITRIS